MKQIIDIICDPDYGDITDFNTGRDITITKSGKGLNTEYSVLAKPKETIATDQYSEEELDEKLPDLDSMFVKKDEDELMALFNGEDPDDKEDEDDDSDEESDEDEDMDYEDLELSELKELCKERGIKIKPAMKRSAIIALLEEYDEEDSDDSEDDEESEEIEKDDSEEDEDDSTDSLMNDVMSAVKSRRKAHKG